MPENDPCNTVSDSQTPTAHHYPPYSAPQQHNEMPSTERCTTDIMSTVLGNFGIWQLRTVLIIFLCKIPASWFMACIMFTAPELYPLEEFRCNYTSTDAHNITADQCYIEHRSAEATKPCKTFQYTSDFYSLIMQFDLVCARDILIAWTQFWHLFGVLAGGIVATKMMSMISPKNVYILGMTLQIACGCITGYAADFNLHCGFRCLSAVCCAMMFTAGHTIITDITGGNYRLGVIILYDTFWSIGVILLPGLSSFFSSWTHIYLGITLPTMLLFLLLKWTPDSPRWLLRNGPAKDVLRVEHMLRKAADLNERSFVIPSDFSCQLKKLRQLELSSPPAPAWIELWHGAKTHLIAVHLALAIFIINFMGMLLNVRSFGRDFVIPNSIAMGFAEIIGCFMALHFTLRHAVWKWQWAGVLNILSGLIGCLGWTFSHAERLGAEEKVFLWMLIALIPKACVSCAQSMILACMGELVEAKKRPVFIFSVVTWARIWLLTAPFIGVLKSFDVALSLTSYSILNVLGGICLCLLTTPRSMPHIPQQAPTNEKEQSPLTNAIWTIADDPTLTTA